MKYLKSKKWWKAAGTRAIKTFFQTFVATIGSAAMFTQVDWLTVASSAGLAALLSLCTSLAGLPEDKTVEEVTEEIHEQV